MGSSALPVVVMILGFVLYLVQEGFRRASRGAAWSVFLGVPLVLTPHWIRINEIGLFPWIKLYSVLLGTCWLTALRFTPLGNRRWALGALFLILLLNIVEAVAKDLLGGHSAHIVLAITGILLILSAPHPIRAIRIDVAGPHRDLHYEGMTRAWIVEYTVWNWVFVYLNYPAIAAHQSAVLGAAFVVGMLEPRRWLQARAYTLATDLLLLATFPHIFLPLTDSAHWTTPGRETVAAGVALLIAASCSTRYVATVRKPNSPTG